jgi:DNA-binding phage protein
MWSIHMKALAKHEFSSNTLSPHEQVNILEIAHFMKAAKLPDEFIASAICTALEFEGVADLVQLWAEETDQNEQDEIIADLYELIEDCKLHTKQEHAYISFNDLTTIAKNIRMFKDSLLGEVIEQGGIKKLSEITHIPQPSLSRFFNSNTMPQRSTLLKIAKALNLNAVKIIMQWGR